METIPPVFERDKTARANTGRAKGGRTMKYQCADCGQWSDTPFPAVYKHWAAAMVIMRCQECAEVWDSEVEPELAKVNANGRSPRRK